MVAREAGVSTATVSYVLNKKDGVSEATRRHVLLTAERLGFPIEQFPSATARQRILGLILPSISNPFYSDLSVGFLEAAQTEGYDVLLTHTHEDQDSLNRAIESMLDRNVEGLAFAIGRSDNASALRRLRQAHVPLVQISRSFQSVKANFVGIDDRAAAAAIMRHAVEHERFPIATVIGPRSSLASAQREAAFVEEAERLGVAIPPELRISGALSMQAGRDAASRLLSDPARPRFVLCGSDTLALGVMSEAMEMDLRVPQDVAISGFDGIEIASTPMIGLTGITQPRLQMGLRSAELLIEHIEHPEQAASQIILPHGVRFGTSCGCSSRSAASSADLEAT